MGVDPGRARFAAQLLGRTRARDAVGVAERLLAVQAQDARSVRLAVRARTRGLTAADVDGALTDGRTLVVGWLNRGTLQLVRREDYWWLHHLTTPQLATGSARRLAQTGVGPDAAARGVSVVERALRDEGPLTRDELCERLQRARVQTAGQALFHVLMRAGLEGVAVRGPLRERHHAYVSAADWLGSPPPVERGQALGELARRYLAGHGPADDHDLAKWAGITLRDARLGLAAAGPSVVGRPDGLLELAGRTSDGAPRACLLDQWDPLLVGWRSRAGLLRDYPRIGTAGAHYRPFAYVAGRAVATWSLRDGALSLEPFAAIAADERRALDADASDLVRFLAGTDPRR